MKTKYKYILKALFTISLTFMVTNCGYNEDVIEELAVGREFAPVALTARVRNQTTVELNWTTRDEVDNYVVEFSADDPDFNTIFKTVQVTSVDLPIQVQLEGETKYSIRIKAISNRGLQDSKWALIDATTLTEQLMLASQPGDIEATQATLRWVANSNVTQIVVQPGDITHDITSQEKIDGVAIITGLTGETDYTATLLNNAKVRGTASFTTGIDVGDNTLVLPTDDLFQMIADAAPGDILLLEQGDYSAQTGIITLDKSITIQGLRTDFKPQLKVSFSIIAGAADVNLIDLDLEGDGNGVDSNNDVVAFNSAGNYNSLLISGCNIHNYNKSLIKGQTLGAILNTLTIENCVVTDVWTNSSDFIDFRNSDVLNLTVKTSTFNNCAPGRDFIRLDAAGDSNNTGLYINVLLENCTLYGVSNTTDRILYIRFLADASTTPPTPGSIIEVRNNLFAQTNAIYSNQSTTAPPTFLNNNYFNADGLITTATRYDNSGTYTTLDPGFADVANGDFTISNQTLLDNQVGDPRWRQ